MVALGTEPRTFNILIFKKYSNSLCLTTSLCVVNDNVSRAKSSLVL